MYVVDFADGPELAESLNPLAEAAVGVDVLQEPGTPFMTLRCLTLYPIKASASEAGQDRATVVWSGSAVTSAGSIATGAV